MDPKLHQQLLELHYGLLPEDEAESLRARMSEDPGLAEAAGRVVRDVRQIAAAARVEVSPVDLKLDLVAATAPDRQTVLKEQDKAPGRSPSKRSALGWVIGLAAAVMLAFSLGGYQYHSYRLARLNGSFPRVIVAGPRALAVGASNHYTVSTATVSGEPISMQLAASLHDLDLDKPVQLDRVETNKDGQIGLDFKPTSSAGRYELRFARVDGNSQSPLARLPVGVAPSAYLTKLATDRPRYQPGDDVYFRTVTLRRSDLKPLEDAPVVVRAEDATGSTLPGMPLTAQVERGVGNGAFTLPRELAFGQYQLSVDSPAGEFPTATQKILVAPRQDQPSSASVRFAQSDYLPGEVVRTEVQFRGADGAPLANAPFRWDATLSGRALYSSESQLDDQGRAQVEFSYPPDADAPVSFFAQTRLENQQSLAVAEVPAAVQMLEARFYPEGGDLVAGVKNRVYFSVRDQLNRPREVAGQIVDDEQHVIREASTRLAGRGKFEFTPQVGRTYRLRLPDVAEPSLWPSLPAVRGDQTLALSVPEPVIGRAAKLKAAVQDRHGDTPIVVAVYCRGRLVSQTPLVTTAGLNTVEFALRDDAEGVLRVTALDCSKSAPRPVAERLVYRQTTRKLDVAIQGLKDGTYLPEEPVELEAAIVDESDRPVANAILGVSVLNKQLTADATQTRSSLASFFDLASQLADSRDIEELDPRLDGSPEAAVAIDLLLGTQGWRTFVEAPVPVFAQQQIARPENESVASTGLLLWDNLDDVRPLYEARSKQLRDEQAQIWATLMIFGGVALAIALVLATLWRLVSSLELALPSFAAAAACVFLGAMLAQSPQHAGVRLVATSFAKSLPPTAVAMRRDVGRQEKFAGGAQPRGVISKAGIDVADQATEDQKVADQELGNAPPPADAAPPPAPLEPAGNQPDFAAPTPAPAQVPAPPAPKGVELPSLDGGPVAQQDGWQFGWSEEMTRVTSARTELAEEAEKLTDRYFKESRSVRELRQRTQDRTNRAAATSNDQPAAETQYEYKPKSRSFADDAENLKQNVGAADAVAPAMRSAAENMDVEALGAAPIVRYYAHEPRLDASFATLLAEPSLYWHPFLTTDENGVARFSFYSGAAEAVYGVALDALDQRGRIGSATAHFRTGPPVELAQKVPEATTVGDSFDLQILLRNTTNAPQNIDLNGLRGENLRLSEPAAADLALRAKESRREYLNFTAETPAENGVLLGVEGKTQTPTDWEFTDRLATRLDVTPSGYPRTLAWAGLLGEQTVLNVQIPAEAERGSLSVRLWLYPGLEADYQHAREALAELPQDNWNSQLALAYINARSVTPMLNGAEGIALAPLGGPVTGRASTTEFNRNLLGLSNFNGYWYQPLLSSSEDTQLAQRQQGGYGGGYSLGTRGSGSAYQGFGSAPRAGGAYGSRGGVAGSYLNGFGANTSFNSFAGGFGYAGLANAPQELVNTWTLANQPAPTGGTPPNDLNFALDYARHAESPSATAVAANGLLNYGEIAAGKEMLGKLAQWQERDGSVLDARKDVVSNRVADTAVAALALFRQPEYRDAAERAVNWLVTQRIDGGFGSADDTYLALRALEAQAAAGQRATGAGEVSIARDGEILARRELDGLQQGLITFDDLAGEVSAGQNALTLKNTTGAAVPYALEVHYHSATAEDGEALPLTLETVLRQDRVELGQSAPLDVKIANTSNAPQEYVVAEIGLPAGLEVPAEQLESAKNKAVVDHFEFKPRTVITYFRKLEPMEQRELPLKATGAASGKFTAPPSTVYRLDAPRARRWSAPLKVEVTRPAE